MACRSKEVKYRSDRDYKGSNSVPTKPRYYIFLFFPKAKIALSEINLAPV